MENNFSERVIQSPAPEPTPSPTPLPLLHMDTVVVSEDYKRAIQNSLKIMDGKYGGGFFVRYILDVGRMYGWLNLVIVYPDGLFKSLILYKNFLKETDTESSNGVCAIDRSKRKFAKNMDFPELDDFVPLPQYETPRMPIPAQALWKLLREHYTNIPVAYICETGSVMGIYDELKAVAEETAKEYGNGFMDADDRFYVSEKDFRDAIESNGRTVSEIRTAFATMGLFIRDKGAGYQFSKRINKERIRFYVLKKPLPLFDSEPQTLLDTAFCSMYQNETEKKFEQLKKENDRLGDRYNDLAMRYNEMAKSAGEEAEDLEI